MLVKCMSDTSSVPICIKSLLQIAYHGSSKTKSFQYGIKRRDLDHKFNTWVPREELPEKGFQKIVSQFDDLDASREGAGQQHTSAQIVRKNLEDIGLDGDIAQITGLSIGK